jgi:hypothetical protein
MVVVSAIAGATDARGAQRPEERQVHGPCRRGARTARGGVDFRYPLAVRSAHRELYPWSNTPPRGALSSAELAQAEPGRRIPTGGDLDVAHVPRHVTRRGGDAATPWAMQADARTSFIERNARHDTPTSGAISLIARQVGRSAFGQSASAAHNTPTSAPISLIARQVGRSAFGQSASAARNTPTSAPISLIARQVGRLAFGQSASAARNTPTSAPISLIARQVGRLADTPPSTRLAQREARARSLKVASRHGRAASSKQNQKQKAATPEGARPRAAEPKAQPSSPTNFVVCASMTQVSPFKRFAPTLLFSVSPGMSQFDSTTCS